MSESRDSILLEGIEGIAPYLDRLVVAGGWAPYLYGRMYGTLLKRESLMTRDMDIVIPKMGFEDGLPTLDKTILGAGFEHEFASLTQPPVVKYVKTEGDRQLAELEFITDAPGEYEGPVEIGSINAQSLRYVGLLLEDPWECNLGDLGFPQSYVVRIPNPSAYVFHKALVAPRRHERAKTAKDLYYIFFVLDAFPEWKDTTLSGIKGYASTRAKWFDGARKGLARRFAKLDSEGVRMLVEQRPATAFPHMDDDQFGRYALAIMGQLIAAMEP
ncbi:GSU2403 family nucleotidyltransferase fold protein [Arabiibacter massiliensis]|uniref:GSU2403 family nucleotidyltransferase fold protein n=1 Tax=Arabiibacter massiliensis TaxID=1870985 RepID=UPI0009BB4997|nr:GSU2403 family nucleotidyltransferase fold protein [Arabiibacter massiliensis]